MSVTGLTGSPSRCSFLIPAIRGRGSTCSFQVSAFPGVGKSREKVQLLHLDRSYLAGPAQQCVTKQTQFIRCAMDASFGGNMTNDRPVIFPRIHVRDPYKRLGISREASEDEIQAARNFLIQQYAGHKPSVDAIESAHDKIIMQKFYERKNPKIDINKKVREIKQLKFVQAVSSRFQTPSTMVIVKTSISFLVLGALTVLFPTEEGPTLQVLISLIATMYFIHDRLKSKICAVLYGIGAFIFSWLLGTFLMVCIIPPLPLIEGLRSFEATTSLITYMLLWIASAYLK